MTKEKRREETRKGYKKKTSRKGDRRIKGKPYIMCTRVCVGVKVKVRRLSNGGEFVSCIFLLYISCLY